MDALFELQKIQDSGIRFTLQTAGHGFTVKLGDYRRSPEAQAVVDCFDQAVSWLREQVKVRYPGSDYSKGLLTN